MKDCFGNELHVDDKVVFVRGASRNSWLSKGFINKIYDNDRECTVNSHSHIYSSRIMKLEDN